MKRLSSLFLLLMMTIVSMGAPVTKQQARQWAQEFMSQRGAQIMEEPRHAPGMAVEAEQQPLYVFNAMDNKGFVIIAGDDCAEHVLGYVTEGSYDENNLPDNFRSWLEMTAEEIREASPIPSKGGVNSPPSPAPFKGEVNDPTSRPRLATHPAIIPLIKTKWSQGSATADGYIYNTLTPTIDGKHCLTGCAATAGAQIMYYYQYPTKKTKKVTGYTRDGSSVNSQTNVDLPAITFKWAQMKKTYSSDDVGSASETAVSQLMKYVGWAAKMKYGLKASSANEYTMAKGMVDFFDYDPYTLSYEARDAYSVSEWDALIYGELAAGRPVIYSGQKWTTGGHAFICDGYDGDGLYHFNWGWGGYCDGYFKLHATNPEPTEQNEEGQFDSGYIMGAHALIGLQPNTGVVPPEDGNANDEWETPEADGIVASVFNSSIDGTTILLGMGNKNEGTYGFGYGMGELNADGTISMVDKRYEYMTTYHLNQWSYYPNRTFDTSTYNLSKGTHKLVPMSLLEGEDTWKRCKPLDMYFEVIVSGGAVTKIVEHPVEDLQVSNLSCTTTRQPYMSQTMSFDVQNNGDNYDGYLYFFVSTTEDKGGCLSRASLKIKAGNTKTRTMSFSAENIGTYNVWITKDWEGNDVLAQTTVKIEQTLQMSKIEFPGNKIATSYQPVIATIKSTQNDYTQPLYLFASKTSSDKGSAIFCAAAAIEAGKTEAVKFYFKPETAGNYQIWICTDVEGNNIIGMGNVTINNAPTGEAKLTLVSLTADGKPRTTAILKVKNNSSVTYYEGFYPRLWIVNGNGFDYVSSFVTDCYTIKPGKTREIEIKFDDLEEGVHYNIDIYYKPVFGGDWVYLGEVYFDGVSGIPTGIGETTPLQNEDVVWYTLDGLRLEGKPTAKGIYVRNGKKTVVK